MAALFGKIKEMVGLTDPMDALEDDYAELDGRDYRELYEREQSHADYAAPIESTAARRRRWTAPHQEVPTHELKHRSPAPRANHHRERPTIASTLGSSSKVIGMPGVQNLQGEVVLLHPHGFEEMAEVIKHLRDRKSVVMNLTLMDPADAQRSVDFVAGGTYAIDGHQERIGENIFLFTPNCIAVTTPGSNGQQETTAAPAPSVAPEPVPLERPSSPLADRSSTWAAVANG